MARQPGLIAEGEMKRIRKCAVENEALARCWGKSHVALVAMEWAPSGLAYSWKGWIARNEEMGYWVKREAMPVLSVEVQPGSPVASGGEVQSSHGLKEAYGHRLWLRSGWTQSVVRAREQWWEAHPRENTQSSFASTTQAVMFLEKLFRELSSTHSTICVCSHRPSTTQQGLADIGFKLPKGTVFVDLVEVLEYQSRFRGIPPALEDYVNSCLDMDQRSGLRLAEKPGEYDGDALALDFDKHAPKYGQPNEWREIIRKKDDVSAGTLSKMLGPEAEVHRRQIDRLEKENLALERAAKALGSDEARRLTQRVKRGLMKERAWDGGSSS